MKRLIIAQIRIEMDTEKSDYDYANIGTSWPFIVRDYLDANFWKVQNRCSIQIDETKDIEINPDK